MRDLHAYREMSSYLMIGVLLFATLSFIWSMYTQSDLAWSKKDETTMDIESTIKNNSRLFFGGPRLSKPKFSNYDESQLLITPKEADETEAAEQTRLSVREALIAQLVESPTPITNGLTFEDLASLDSTSSNYSASYLRSLLQSDTSSSMSGSTYRPRGSYNSQQRNTLSSPFDDGSRRDSVEKNLQYNVYSLREQELFQQDADPLEFEG